MNTSFNKSFIALKNYCESQNFSGWDPYDGLNSKIFQATPLKYLDFARLAWIQFFKRSPFNFRKLFMVPKEHNAKGIGLFLTGYCNIYKVQKASGKEIMGTQKEIYEQINNLANLLLSMQSKGYSGSCWGYNFDWQIRTLYLFPKYTPTVVATTFCATALFEAYQITKNETWLQTALSAANFIMNDLNRTPKRHGFLFSYSPLNGNNTVYNASLLGSKLLSYCYKYSKDENLKSAAFKSIRACVDSQQPDGSWLYGELPVQNWIDSFHTGYNLDAIQAYQNYTGDNSFQANIEKGFDFYIKNFFLEDGTPKYYHNKTYPIDKHCPGQLFVTLNRLNKFEENRELADKVMHWSIQKMQDQKGYFYYQLKNGINSKISYMRWSNAFMFYAMSYYFKSIMRK
ncbi:MAG: delta-aminolevulinic acid dehydratase [bacterium]